MRPARPLEYTEWGQNTHSLGMENAQKHWHVHSHKSSGHKVICSAVGQGREGVFVCVAAGRGAVCSVCTHMFLVAVGSWTSLQPLRTRAFPSVLHLPSTFPCTLSTAQSHNAAVQCHSSVFSWFSPVSLTSILKHHIKRGIRVKIRAGFRVLSLIIKHTDHSLPPLLSHSLKP